MSDSPSQPVLAPDAGRVVLYNDLVSEAGDTLSVKLANIRRDEDAGDITVREAADERIAVMSQHLTRLRLLREEFLG